MQLKYIRGFPERHISETAMNVILDVLVAQIPGVCTFPRMKLNVTELWGFRTTNQLTLVLLKRFHGMILPLYQ